MIPTREAIEATTRRARTALDEVRGHARALEAEMRFMRWLSLNDPGDAALDPQQGDE